MTLGEFWGESHSTHAATHGNAFSRTRYCAHMEMYFLVCDIAHCNSRAISCTWKAGLSLTVHVAFLGNPTCDIDPGWGGSVIWHTRSHPHGNAFFSAHAFQHAEPRAKTRTWKAGLRWKENIKCQNCDTIFTVLVFYEHISPLILLQLAT